MLALRALALLRKESRVIQLVAVLFLANFTVHAVLESLKVARQCFLGSFRKKHGFQISDFAPVVSYLA